jgi:3-oxoacyl-[acyl-carrier protein] reductase
VSVQIDLAGRRAVVTGAASGIGRAIALGLARAGAAVVVNHLASGEAAEAVVAECGAPSLAVEADVSRADDVTRLIATAHAALGGVDILVNNAAVMLVKPFLELTEDDWDRVLANDLKSVFLCCRATLPGMLAQGGGTIINIASELAYLGRAQYAAYTAAKGGVLALTRSLAREFAPTIRVNGIAPGPTLTPMMLGELAVTGALEAETAIPAGRLGRPEEIAATAVFLASNHASFYHGEVLSPNGGALMR